MALDEYLFGKFVRYFKHKKNADESLLMRTVKLERIKHRLTLISRAVTGHSIDVFPAVKEGGFKGNCFFLPQQFSFYASYEQNLSFYFFRTLYLYVQKKLRLNWYEEDKLTDVVALQSGKESAPLVLKSLFDEFPAAQEIFDALVTTKGAEKEEQLNTAWLYGRWMQDKPEINKKGTEAYNEATLKNTVAPFPKTTLKAKAVEEIVNLTIDTKQQEDYVLTHNFEKVDTADEFSGSWRDFDGEDELEDHADALEELTMKYTVRTNDVTHSVYQAEFTDNTHIAESSEVAGDRPFILYDEWDCFKNKYRKDYAKLYPESLALYDTGYYHDTIKQNQTLLLQLRKMLANMNNRRTEQRLQMQGREIDIDMATDRFAEIVSKQTPSERVYISDKKLEKDLAVLLLIDISLSSDSYVDGNRIIDVARQTAILFGEILDEYHIDFSIQGFYSQTRNCLSYITVKDFGEKWNKARYKIGAMQPAGYTRIGAALRHSGALMQQRDSKNKWVILLSDGKPNDFDRYEGKYGVHDVKQALRELNQNHINNYALAIESSARYYLPQMFGRNHYQVVSSPKELICSMAHLYEKIRYS